jgi:hypothetical protein
VSAALGEHQAKCLEPQLNPAIGFELAHADDLAAGGNDDGGDSNGLVVHKKSVVPMKFSCSRQERQST